MASRDISDLRPKTQEKIILFEQRLAAAGLPFRRSCTFRSQTEQNALWMRGRRSLRDVNAAFVSCGMLPITDEQNKHKVTWRTVSIHTDRRAVDYYEAVNGNACYDLKIDVDKDGTPDWQEFVKIAQECGLEAGGAWRAPDWPHVQDNEVA